MSERGRAYVPPDNDGPPDEEDDDREMLNGHTPPGGTRLSRDYGLPEGVTIQDLRMMSRGTSKWEPTADDFAAHAQASSGVLEQAAKESGLREATLRVPYTPPRVAPAGFVPVTKVPFWERVRGWFR
jgi:hypothetical protein